MEIGERILASSSFAGYQKMPQLLTITQPPKILSKPGLGRKPFWSVMIPVYNRTAYLEKVLNGVLSQDPGAEEMQIVVVDDASTEGDAEAIVRRVCGDRVSFVRQRNNIGGVANWNSCVEKSVGEWVHILHSDDIVYPGFYAYLKAALERRSDIGAAFCRHETIDENDCKFGDPDLEAPTSCVLPHFIERLAVAQRIQFPSIVVRRAVYEGLGGFRTDLSYAADWEMWIRIAAHYPVWYEPATLAAFRIHSGSWTAAAVRSAETIKDEQRCIALVRPFLPPEQADEITRRAREIASLKALSFAKSALCSGAFTTGFSQLWGGLKCSLSANVIRALLLLPIRITRDCLRRPLRRLATMPK